MLTRVRVRGVVCRCVCAAWVDYCSCLIFVCLCVQGLAASHISVCLINEEGQQRLSAALAPQLASPYHSNSTWIIIINTHTHKHTIMSHFSPATLVNLSQLLPLSTDPQFTVSIYLLPDCLNDDLELKSFWRCTVMFWFLSMLFCWSFYGRLYSVHSHMTVTIPVSVVLKPASCHDWPAVCRSIFISVAPLWTSIRKSEDEHTVVVPIS